MSSDSTRLFLSVSGTSPLTMRCARPSTIAVLPTPGSPISTGLFLVRRCRIWMVRRISSSRPITGSSLPWRARSVRSMRVFLQRLALAFGFLRVDAGAAAHRVDRALERLAGEAVLLQQPAGVALVVGQRQQEQFRGDELVAALGRFLVGEVEQVAELARDGDLAALALDLGQALDRLGERRLEPRHGDAGAGEQRRGAAVLLVEQRREQVLRLDEAVVVAERHALGIGERLLELGRELVETHGIVLRAGCRSGLIWGKPRRFQGFPAAAPAPRRVPPTPGVVTSAPSHHPAMRPRPDATSTRRTRPPRPPNPRPACCRSSAPCSGASSASARASTWRRT